MGAALAATATTPIAAIATAPGRGGIGVVRISGEGLQPLLEALLGAATAARLRPRTALRAAFLDAAGRAIDDGLVLWFPAPHSYTGETVVECHGHGGPTVLQLLLERCLEAGRPLGLRIAAPGEFTQRAFLNGRLDLAQAEAVADLIDAGSAAAARAARRSLAGEFSREIDALVEQLTELRALVEATLDFPEEEIDFLQATDAGARLQGLRSGLDALLVRSRQGAVLREGMTVVLVGAPNVGKSSLLNRLAGAEVAIVTPVAGTTRDRIRQPIELEGVPLHVVDTAGIRATGAADEVERIGIARTFDEVERADVVVHVVAADGPAASDPDRADAEVLAQVRARLGPQVPLLTVLNKLDLAPEAPVPTGGVRVSALTGAGVDGLRRALLQVVGWGPGVSGEGVVLARRRHLDALQRAAAHLAEAAGLAAPEHGPAPLELLAEELRLAGNALGEITGAVHADEILGRIFATFCIGK